MKISLPELVRVTYELINENENVFAPINSELEMLYFLDRDYSLAICSENMEKNAIFPENRFNNEKTNTYKIINVFNEYSNIYVELEKI